MTRCRVAPWSGAGSTAALAALAALVAVQVLTRPEWTPSATPAVLGAATLAVAGALLAGSRRCSRGQTVVWRVVAGVAGLEGLGQLARAVAGSGVAPGPVLSVVVLLAAAPAVVRVCLALVGPAGGRLRRRFLLDGLIALGAVVVLLQWALPLAPVAGGSPLGILRTVVQPVVAGVLLAAGSVVLCAVPARWRPAAGWSLVATGSFAASAVSGALAVGSPSPVLDVVTATAHLALLAAAAQALAAAPDPSAGPARPAAPVPLAGVVVSQCFASGAVVLVLGGVAVGEDVGPAQAGVLAVVVLTSLVRTLAWASDGTRLARYVLRTEAWLRTLVHRGADRTLAVDGRGLITWISSPGQEDGAPAPDLEGRLLSDVVHPEDRERAGRVTEGGAGVVLRFRDGQGAWRPYEAVLTGLPAGTGDGVVLHLRDLADRRTDERELERLAYTDYLTGLPNRARFMADLDAAVVRAARGVPACLLLVDLDGFKAVNDVAGHEAGDHLLCEIADVLRSGARDGDLVGRLGGDEFALLVPGGTAEAGRLAERLVSLLDRAFRAPGPGDGQSLGPGPVFTVSGSIGLAELRPGEDATAVVRHADLALRAAKAAGKGCVRSSGAAIDSAMGRRARLARDLPAALAEGQLRLLYQPVVGVSERAVLGLEALVRWEHPVLGTVPPDEFIGLAEEDGLIVPLQQWVLDRALTDAAELFRAGHRFQIGVNVSVRHLQTGGLAPDVARALTASGVPAEHLVLEITESVMLDEEDRVTADLGILRDMGCVLALDDFGRGWSSLAYLARLPVQILKMDREFVAGIEDDPRAAALVASVIDLGRTLGIDVVAEGVETAGQAALLRGMDCRYLQGHLFGRPVPLAEIRAVLDSVDPSLLGGTRPEDLDAVSTA